MSGVRISPGAPIRFATRRARRAAVFTTRACGASGVTANLGRVRRLACCPRGALDATRRARRSSVFATRACGASVVTANLGRVRRLACCPRGALNATRRARRSSAFDLRGCGAKVATANLSGRADARSALVGRNASLRRLADHQNCHQGVRRHAFSPVHDSLAYQRMLVNWRSAESHSCRRSERPTFPSCRINQRPADRSMSWKKTG